MRKHFNRCYLLIIIFTIIGSSARAQDTIIKYYDSTWLPTSKETAFFYSRYEMLDNYYLCHSYWVNSGNLFSIATYSDIALLKKVGLYLHLYENGQVSDSAFHDMDGNIKLAYHFYDNGQLADSTFYGENGIVDSGFHYYKNGMPKAYYSYNKLTKKELLQAFDESGKPMTVKTYAAEASFKGGPAKWMNFLQRNLDPLVPMNNNAPAGRYTVIARFIVKSDGTLDDIRTETNFGYGMENEVIRLLKKSPKWLPAVFLDKPLNAYRRQPITFEVAVQ